MFERFTRPARDAVIRAQTEARQLRHPSIGTPHLLLALLAPEADVAHAVLSGAGLDATTVRDRIGRRAGTPAGPLSEADAAALRTVGIDLDAVLAKIEETFGPDALRPAPPAPRRGLLGRRWGVDHVPFSPRAKKVLELALREALHLRHNYIGTEHLLLGLLRDGDPATLAILQDAGVGPQQLRSAVLAALSRAA